MSVQTNWLVDLKGQDLFVDGTQLLPTKKAWNLIGVDATYNSTTDQIDISIGGSGFDWQESVRAATTADLNATRVGNVLTANGNGALTVDAIAMAAGDRLLVKNEATGADNGIYVVSAAGSGSTPFVLTRDTLADETGEITPGLTVLTEEGTANAGIYFRCTNTGAVVLNSTAITFAVAFSASTGVSSSSIPSIDNRIARYDSTTGQIIQESLWSINDIGDLSLAPTGTSPDIFQEDDGGGGALGDTMTIRSQSCTGAASTGGDLHLRPGSGTNTSGELELQTGASAVALLINAAGTQVKIWPGASTESLFTTSLVTLNQPLAVNQAAGAVSTTGDIRLRSGFSITHNQAGVNRRVIDVDGSGNMTIGATSPDGPNGLALTAQSFVQAVITGASRCLITSTLLSLTNINIEWAVAHATPTINQIVNTGAGATGNPFLSGAQDCSGTSGTKTGGARTDRAGDVTGAGTNIGGAYLSRGGDASGGTDTGGAWRGRSGDGDTDGDLFLSKGTTMSVLGTSGTGMTIGGTVAAGTQPDTIDLGCDSELRFNVGGATQATVFATLFDVAMPLIQFGTAQVAPVFNQQADASAGATGDQLTVQAQSVTATSGTKAGGILGLYGGDVTGTGTSNTGGNAHVRGGDASGGTANTGGDAIIEAGTGATAAGAVRLQTADGVDRIFVNATSTRIALTGSLGFFGTTGVTLRGPYSIANSTPDRTYDVSTVTLTELANVVAAILQDLGDAAGYGILNTDI